VIVADAADSAPVIVADAADSAPVIVADAADSAPVIVRAPAITRLPNESSHGIRADGNVLYTRVEPVKLSLEVVPDVLPKTVPRERVLGEPAVNRPHPHSACVPSSMK
jgi:hypothetical protein